LLLDENSIEKDFLTAENAEIAEVYSLIFLIFFVLSTHLCGCDGFIEK